LIQSIGDVFAAIDIVNYGEVMLREAAFQGLDRDTLRHLPIEKQQEIGLAASHKIAQANHHLTISIHMHALKLQWDIVQAFH
jgi:adenylate kinase